MRIDAIRSGHPGEEPAMRLSRRILAAGLAAGAVALGTAVAAGAATKPVG